MLVPDEITLNLDELELVVVHLCYHLGGPLVREAGELFPQVYLVHPTQFPD